MADRDDVAALEASLPWQQDDFRADLAALTASTVAAARQFAADARVLARLTARVPRQPGDERGGTAWTSFRQEVAVARRISGQAAAAEIRTAVRLTTVLPRTLALLEQGDTTVARARAFVDELEPYDDTLASEIDLDLAEHAARLSPYRIRHAVRRAALRLDPDSAAARTATATARRAVTLTPQPDGQASVCLTGPAVPLTRWHATLDRRARALRAAGDPRTLDALRFDLATSTWACSTHAPAEPDPDSGEGATGPGNTAPAGLRPSGVEAASTDCRLSRPVQAMIVVPVETALGLSSDPAWLDGYGWIDAPTSRLLLIDAQLRQVCAQTGTGQLVDLADRDRRPPPDPDGVRSALLDMVQRDVTPTDTAWRTEPEHDPSDPLRTFVTLRDRLCDGPTQPAAPASRCELDHDEPHPTGPTAAWNLRARTSRTHQLKHYGWTPLRTATSTVWTSPAGQVVEVPHSLTPPPGIDPHPDCFPALPPAQQLADTDLQQLTPTTPDDLPPWLPSTERIPATDWTCLGHDIPAPF